MRIADFDLKSMLEFQPGTGKLLLGSDRMLLFRQDAFASLRKLLHEQLGEALARALLMQFGYRCGAGDHRALSAAYTWDTELDEMSAGPVMHTWEGLVHVEPTMLDFDRKTSRFHMTGIWRNSYEAEVHLKELGRAERPVCHSLTGYASGWCTSFLGAPLLAIETMCMGTGAPECRFEIRRPDAWGPEADTWRGSLHATDYSISRELEEKLAEIERQRTAIAALSTPILQVWEGVLALPVIGAVDAARAAQIMDDLLGAVSRAGARYAILDLTGVASIDTHTAHHLLKIVRAIELLGAQSIITGLTPEVAQILVKLGVDTAGVRTLGTLQSALLECMRATAHATERRG